ncbi:MAG TPA: hypothetical protein VEP90_11685 [Methylomirabilota bacterium]|nr:hypothetical protein [Methylomirabilota bacterium]
MIEGLRTAYEILLSSASRGEVLRYFYPYDDYHEIASPFYSRLYQFQKSKGLEERGISSTKFKQSKSVTSKEIADHFKNYFDSIWKMGSS